MIIKHEIANSTEHAIEVHLEECQPEYQHYNQ